MGIPSYFSHVIRKYKNTVRNKKYFVDTNTVFTHLYMDCNSIIYDSFHDLSHKYDSENEEVFEDMIIMEVVSRIKDYISMINPTKLAYIAFDGVAPLAKMDQQRTRRYKTYFTSQIRYDESDEKIKSWNVSSITPGTLFQEKLCRVIKSSVLCSSVIVSCSEVAGEGEQKMYSSVRSCEDVSMCIGVYGLDADLLMLSLLHVRSNKKMYIFREAREFEKSALVVDGLSDVYFVDIECLSKSIIAEMECNDAGRMSDYVLMCFLLGNDFLPHLPCLNIRRDGLSILLDVYKKKIVNSSKWLISRETGKIKWKSMRLLIEELSKMESELLKREYTARKKFDKSKYCEKSREEKEKVLLNAPVIYRYDEKYICPDENGWEKRYYKNLIGNDKNIKDVCQNYLEGIEWVYKYYTGDCPDWKWKYNYNYPPLLDDLYKCIPHFDTEFMPLKVDNRPFSPYTQLAYVLPKKNLYLLPKKIQEFLLKNYEELYPEKFEFKWAFCRYFWESHPVIPEIPVKLLETWNHQFISHTTNVSS